MSFGRLLARGTHQKDGAAGLFFCVTCLAPVELSCEARSNVRLEVQHKKRYDEILSYPLLILKSIYHVDGRFKPKSGFECLYGLICICLVLLVYLYWLNKNIRRSSIGISTIKGR